MEPPEAKTQEREATKKKHTHTKRGARKQNRKKEGNEFGLVAANHTSQFYLSPEVNSAFGPKKEGNNSNNKTKKTNPTKHDAHSATNPTQPLLVCLALLCFASLRFPAAKQTTTLPQ